MFSNRSTPLAHMFVSGLLLSIGSVQVHAQTCQPATDGTLCTPDVCSDVPEVQCIATVVHLDVTTGALSAGACECMNFNHCHVEFGDASPRPAGYCPDGTACHIVASDANNDGIPDTFTAECSPDPASACCLDIDDGPVPFDTCVMLDRDACHSEGGYFPDVNTGCDDIQACCLPGGICAELNPHCCVASGGVHLGPGSTCTDAAGQNSCGQICGGFAYIPCENAEEFCRFPPGWCCCDQQGVCTTIPAACDAVWEPVCGCDGNTYGNECEASAQGVSIDHDGPCGRPCSNVLGAPSCPDTEFCLFPDGTCDNGTEFGVCTPRPDGCPDVWDPVCGCDGHTYSNECDANAAGVSILHRGECVPVETGACCLPNSAGDVTCVIATRDACHVEGGDWQGPGTTCPTDPTEPCGTPTGACCVHDAATNVRCFVGTTAECSDAGGAYQGNGTSCPTDPNTPCGSPCPMPCATGQECLTGCGELIQGVECILFRADSGGLFILESLGDFAVGDRVFVAGCYQPDCNSFCMQGDGCILNNIIRSCGQVCGGIAGIPCEDAGEFCKLPEGHCCCDFFGVCTALPTGCPDVWDPVCGCDDMTYGNECEADAAGVSIAYWGECQPASCWSNDMCRPDQYCFFHVCAVETGACMPRPETCPDIWEPVCGCDGVTYPNACEAARTGMSVDHHGACDIVCRPADHGFGCVPLACSPIPEDQCLTRELRLDLATGANLTTVCECMDFNLCHIEFVNGMLEAVGQCPDGGTCELVGVDTDGDGIDDLFRAVCGALGACCGDMGGSPLPVPGCWMAPRDQCEAGGGFFEGVGTTCDMTQACCLTFGSEPLCLDLGPHCCRSFGGIPQGPGSTCTNVDVHGGCGEICGGFAGIPCANDHDFCKLPEGHCCCDYFGVCTPKPTVCPDVWRPVCGCDGETYGNECEADAVGVSIDHDGPCEHLCTADSDCPAVNQFCMFPPGTCGDATIPGVCTAIPEACPEYFDPVCGCDGRTYDNECFAHAAGVSIQHHGPCEHFCVADSDCPAVSQFCKFPEGSCGTASIPGICTERPGGCPDNWDPVCGCDGATYGNECEADAAGVSIKYRGECEPLCCDPHEAPQCIEGLFCCADGNWACGDGSGGPPAVCEEPGRVCGNTCGGPVQIPCYANDVFCKYPTGTCGHNNAFGTCTPIPGNGCPEYYYPVCGCDGVTYINDCEADAAGVSIAHVGACEVGNCAATRSFVSLDPSYCVGMSTTVVITLTPPAGTTVIALDDAPPSGWVVSNISNEGEYDPNNGKVKWGPFFAPFPAQVSYTVTPSNDTALPACFAGMISIDGINQVTCGDECLEPCCRHMPADVPQTTCSECRLSSCADCEASSCDDGRISLCEVIVYACSWFKGCHDDLAGMTRAAYIWRRGECYCWDDADQNWFPTHCPSPASGCCDSGNSSGGPAISSTGTGGATALLQIPSQTGDSRSDRVRDMKVPITINAPQGTLAAGLEMRIPRGWELTAASDKGEWDELHRKVKWGPFFDDLSRTVTFKARRTAIIHSDAQATRSRGSKRLQSFSGTVSFDGVNQPITIE